MLSIISENMGQKKGTITKITEGYRRMSYVVVGYKEESKKEYYLSRDDYGRKWDDDIRKAIQFDDIYAAENEYMMWKKCLYRSCLVSIVSVYIKALVTKRVQKLV